MDKLKSYFKKEGILFNAPNVLLAMGKSIKDPAKQAKVFNQLFGLRGVAGGIVAAKNITKVIKTRGRLLKFTNKESLEYMKKNEDSMKKNLRELESMKSSADELKETWGNIWLVQMRPVNRELANMFQAMTKNVKKSEDLKMFIGDVGTLLKGSIVLAGLLGKALAKPMRGYSKMADWFARIVVNPVQTGKMLFKNKAKELIADQALRMADSPEALQRMREQRDRLRNLSTGPGYESGVQGARSAQGASESRHILEFKNAPKGSRLTSPGGVPLHLGNQMVIDL